MSLVYITYHNENIHDFDKEGDNLKRQKFKYTSKYRETIKKETQQPRLISTADGKKLLAPSGKYEHRTMGYVHTPLNPPSEFMRKYNGIKWLRIPDHVCPKEKHLPPIPRYISTAIQPPIQKSEDKCERKKLNFIALNIDRVKQLQPKRPIPRYIDTPNGDRHNLLNTGLILQYVKNKNFGKVPSYLRTHKKMANDLRNIRTTDQRSFNQMDDYRNMFGTRQLTNEERQSILDGLKTNFMEQSKVFQRLSLYTDTLAKKLRKARIENVLRQLEQDIYLLEKNPIIYVSNF